MTSRASEADGATAPPASVSPVAGFERRRRLDFDGSASEIQDAVVRVRLDPTRVDFDAAGPMGASLRFFSSELEDLPYEVERWSPGSGAELWVSTRGVEEADGYIWMYYGHEDPPPLSTAAVWPSDAIAVYHLADATDSTASALDATDEGTSPTDGLVGGARHFDGVGLRLEPDSMGIDVGTVSLWFRTSVTQPASLAPLLLGSANPAANGFGPGDEVHLALFRAAASDDWSVDVRRVAEVTDGQIFLVRAPPDPTWIDAHWHHVVATWELSESLALYVDGVRVGDTPLEGAKFDFSGLFIAGRVDLSDFPNRYYVGDMDELELYDFAASDAWVELQYASQSDALFSFSAEQLGPF